LDEGDRDWIDPFGEAVERLNSAGLTSGPIDGGVGVVGGPMDLAVPGPERLRLQHRAALTVSDQARITEVMGEVPYELALVTIAGDGAIVLEDGTVDGRPSFVASPRQV
jgi:hypothetical protein